MDIITEVNKWLEGENQDCNPETLVANLLLKLEQKEREAVALEDALKKANLCCCDNEEKSRELKAEVKERWQTDTIKNKQINKLLAENERLMGGFSMKNCKSYVTGQQIICDRCGYTWDINDPEPPECKIELHLQGEPVAGSVDWVTSEYGTDPELPTLETVAENLKRIREVLKK